MNVDLTLAVNYLPACTCLCKVIILLITTLVLLPTYSTTGLTITAGVIYMDRLLTRNFIFDANAILITVFFSHIYAVIRSQSTHRSYPFLMYGAHLSWAAACIVMIVDAYPGKSSIDIRTKLMRWSPPLLLVLMVSVMTYFHEEMEPIGIMACRSLVFTVLAFAWIYVVGVHSSQCIDQLKESSYQFIARLGPILFSPLAVAMLFCPAATAALIFQYLKLVHPESIEASPANAYHPVYQSFVPLQEIQTQQVSEEDDSDTLRELLKSAKQGTVRTKLDTISELS